MNQFQPNNQISQQLAHAEQLIQQMVHQTQQASGQYQQLLKQEQNNAVLLEQIAQREQQAVQIIQTALQGHQTAIQQLQQISGICNQMAHTASQQVPAYMNMNNQTTGFSGYSQH
ncbi:AMP-dependent synthetase and ligase [Paenibacillus alkaliterrae]|uniref:AMP-dependent synthetase and ligase n=1 Tax=Paenibacillus alkaliterrae TaxID=320909 RepID=UPI001F29CA67|nr:AMP-dependent synthetase and ligase [Paenibacillus alkaliterrae]MCF2941206.1 AMP-dependent synthetase and ligase [Paenibacillus alkaliterrae]